MDGNWSQGGGCSVVRNKGEAGKRKAPRVVCWGELARSASIADQFERLGWELCPATLGQFAAMAARKNPQVVLIPAVSAQESGYLTCAKLRMIRPELRVVLIGERNPRAERFARFVGATLATEATAADAVRRLF